MPSSKSEDRQAREARERLKGYQARKTLHDRSLRRRVRDNWIGGILVVVVAAGAVGGQLLFFSAGPGASEAAPTPAATAANENVPSPDIAEARSWPGTLSINDVPLGFELNGAAAPQAVSSFISLTRDGFYNGLTCHRLTNGGFFVLQCGDPTGSGSGGPGYSYGPVENAPVDDVYPAGTLAMARSGGDGNSMGSQFFIVYEDTTIPSDAAGGYTVLGQITTGLDELRSKVTSVGVVDGGTDGAPAAPITITSVTLD